MRDRGRDELTGREGGKRKERGVSLSLSVCVCVCVSVCLCV